MCCGQRQKVDRQGNKVTRPKGVALGGGGRGASVGAQPLSQQDPNLAFMCR